jgi:hypothetical protein
VSFGRCDCIGVKKGEFCRNCGRQSHSDPAPLSVYVGDPPKAPTSDFRFDNHGSIVILWAETPAAGDWVDEHLPVDRQCWGTNGTAIEPRCMGNILDGIHNAGLTIA